MKKALCCKECQGELQYPRTTGALCGDCHNVYQRNFRKPSSPCILCGTLVFGRNNFCIEHHKDPIANACRRRYNCYKHRIKGYTDITIKWVWDKIQEQNHKCLRTGVDLHIAPVSSVSDIPFNYLSIDRVDSSIGYLQSNCEVVCYMYNIMKNQFTDEDIKTMVQGLLSKNPDWAI